MKRKRAYIAAGVMLVSGVAFAACVTKPMPPLGLINISFWDIAVAGAQGYQNPARAAALKNLDEAAKNAVGATNWKANNFAGNVAYKFANDAVLVTEDKPCDKEAKDAVPKGSTAPGSVGSGGGGFSWGSGRVWTGGGVCAYGCTGSVEVGPIQEV